MLHCGSTLGGHRRIIDETSVIGKMISDASMLSSICRHETFHVLCSAAQDRRDECRCQLAPWGSHRQPLTVVMLDMLPRRMLRSTVGCTCRLTFARGMDSSSAAAHWDACPMTSFHRRRNSTNHPRACHRGFVETTSRHFSPLLAVIQEMLSSQMLQSSADSLLTPKRS